MSIANGKVAVVSNGKESIADTLIKAIDRFHYIGTFAGIEISVARGVDRAHGEDALERMEVYDTDGANVPEGGRVVDRAGGVVNKIIIIGEKNTIENGTIVRHIGGGVLEVRVTDHRTGGWNGILGNGREDIKNNIIITLIKKFNLDRVYA